MQATMSASPACTARAARRSAITPEAPPVGMWSSQRGLTPRCWVTPTAVSGASEKLLTVRPSIALLGDAGARDQRLQRLADEPVRAVGRVAHGRAPSPARRRRRPRTTRAARQGRPSSSPAEARRGRGRCGARSPGSASGATPVSRQPPGGPGRPRSGRPARGRAPGTAQRAGAGQAPAPGREACGCPAETPPWPAAASIRFCRRLSIRMS